jgi:hypothetical protein
VDFWGDVLRNAVGEVLVWGGLGLLFLLGVRLTQRRFRRFFGLDCTESLVIYLSNLWPPSEGNREGLVISGHEFRVTESVNKLFGGAPFRLPELVRGLVDSFWLRDKVATRTVVSPLLDDALDLASNMIIVGSTARNSVRRHCVHTGAPYLLLGIERQDFTANSPGHARTTAHIIKGRRSGTAISGEYNLAVVEKICDEEHQTAIFMCLGVRADSSWTATEYLVRHWRQLSKKYGRRPFALCLGFPKGEDYMNAYEDPVVLASLPE